MWCFHLLWNMWSLSSNSFLAALPVFIATPTVHVAFQCHVHRVFGSSRNAHDFCQNSSSRNFLGPSGLRDTPDLTSWPSLGPLLPPPHFRFALCRLFIAFYDRAGESLRRRTCDKAFQESAVYGSRCPFLFRRTKSSRHGRRSPMSSTCLLH